MRRAAGDVEVNGKEVLYPVAIHLLDLIVVDETALGEPWPVGLGLATPLNVVASGSMLEKLADGHPAKFEALRAKVATDQAIHKVLASGF